jgi:hypothetical protein
MTLIYGDNECEGPHALDPETEYIFMKQPGPTREQVVRDDAQLDPKVRPVFVAKHSEATVCARHAKLQFVVNEWLCTPLERSMPGMFNSQTGLENRVLPRISHIWQRVP